MTNVSEMNNALNVMLLIENGCAEAPAKRFARQFEDKCAEVARLRRALEKIRDDNYPPSDLEIRDCKQPEMIWQSIARRALEQHGRSTNAEGQSA